MRTEKKITLNLKTHKLKETNKQKQRICSSLQHYCLSYGAEHTTCRHAAFVYVPLRSGGMSLHRPPVAWNAYCSILSHLRKRRGNVFLLVKIWNIHQSHLKTVSSSNMRSFINMHTPLHLRGQTGLLGSSASQPRSRSCSHWAAHSARWAFEQQPWTGEDVDLWVSQWGRSFILTMQRPEILQLH